MMISSQRPGSSSGPWRPAHPAASLPFVVGAVGSFGPGKLRIVWQDRARPTTDELEELITAAWDAKVEQTQRTGGILFDGALARYLHHEVCDGCLELLVGPTSYRDFVGTNLANRHQVGRFGWQRFSNPVGTTATIITRDGWLLYGRRSARVAYHAGYLHTFGGSLEQCDVAAETCGASGRGTIDAFASIRRELQEEIHLADDEIDELVCLGLIRDCEILQPELIFDATVRLRWEALLERLDPTDPYQEHVAIEACRDEPDALAPFLQGAGKIAPVAVAAVLLHGWRRWGHAWFDEAARALTRRGAGP